MIHYLDYRRATDWMSGRHTNFDLHPLGFEQLAHLEACYRGSYLHPAVVHYARKLIRWRALGGAS